MKRGKPKTDAPKKADTKLAVRKGSERSAKKANAEKDPTKPKRPPSAFFVFMEGFRKTYKEKHPNNKSVYVVGRAGGDKWKTMSEEDKAPYVAKAAKLKTEYTKKLATYNKNQSSGGRRAAAEADEDESDKSKSEVHDDDEEGSEELPVIAMKQGKLNTHAPKMADTRLAVRKGSKQPAKKAKAENDPKKPKQPPSDFFVFMEGFRKTYKEKHPTNKSVYVVGRAGGDKWKTMSEEDKAPYVAKAAKLMTEYSEKLATYNKNKSVSGSRPAAEADEDESDKSKSEVHDDDDLREILGLASGHGIFWRSLPAELGSFLAEIKAARDSARELDFIALTNSLTINMVKVWRDQLEIVAGAPVLNNAFTEMKTKIAAQKAELNRALEEACAESAKLQRKLADKEAALDARTVELMSKEWQLAAEEDELRVDPPGD